MAAAGTIALALMLAACGGGGDSPGASGGTLQPAAANGNKPDQPGKPGSCSTRCAP